MGIFMKINNFLYNNSVIIIIIILLYIFFLDKKVKLAKKIDKEITLF